MVLTWVSHELSHELLIGAICPVKVIIVVGRKGYYGSGAIWSGELAALMFTIFATLKCWGLNSHTWLIAYFQSCTSAEKVPDNFQSFLPWNMTEAEKVLFSAPPAGENSS